MYVHVEVLLPAISSCMAARLCLFAVLSQIVSYTLSSLSQQVVAQFLAWLYHVHWTIYLPICLVSYYVLGLGQTIRSFIISSVTDEIFFYGRCCRKQNWIDYIFASRIVILTLFISLYQPNS